MSRGQIDDLRQGGVSGCSKRTIVAPDARRAQPPHMGAMEHEQKGVAVLGFGTNRL
jgi:hypothetical protein